MSVCLYVWCVLLASLKGGKILDTCYKTQQKLSSPKPIKTWAQNPAFWEVEWRGMGVGQTKQKKPKTRWEFSRLSTTQLLNTARSSNSKTRAQNDWTLQLTKDLKEITYWKRNSSKKGRKEKGKSNRPFWERDEKYIHQDKTKKQLLIPRAREFNKIKQQKDLYLSIFNWARKRGERGPDRNHTHARTPKCKRRNLLCTRDGTSSIALVERECVCVCVMRRKNERKILGFAP